MNELEDSINAVEGKLEDLHKNVSKAIERGNRSRSNDTYYVEKVRKEIDDIIDDIETIKIILENGRISNMNSDKVIASLKSIKSGKKLEEVKEAVENLETEFRKFRIQNEINGHSQIPKSLENIIGLLDERFEDEIKELKDVYGRNSLSSAFLLRRITEKSIFFSFTDIGKTDELKNNNGNFVGLAKMINTARGYEHNGTMLLKQKTGERLQDVKFLGDVAAHNFLRTVSMNEIDAEIHKLEAALNEIN